MQTEERKSRAYNRTRIDTRILIRALARLNDRRTHSTQRQSIAPTSVDRDESIHAHRTTICTRTIASHRHATHPDVCISEWWRVRQSIRRSDSNTTTVVFECIRRRNTVHADTDESKSDTELSNIPNTDRRTLTLTAAAAADASSFTRTRSRLNRISSVEHVRLRECKTDGCVESIRTRRIATTIDFVYDCRI
ncbi:MAG: hypothetical protein Q7T57_08315, partial [Dehalococcoidales bacterium]|nr:hypothetical protein [Dehalococcoidales bacterium]